MTAKLSRLTVLGGAPETTQGVPVAPTFSLPVLMSLKPETKYAPLKDESYKGNDSLLQGVLKGPADSHFDFEVYGYPDVIGNLFRGIIGPDVVTSAITTTTAALSTAGAVSV